MENVKTLSFLLIISFLPANLLAQKSFEELEKLE